MQLNCRGKKVELIEPKIMGILNVTPDSFYDGNASLDIDDYVDKVELMIHDGASIIDVGGMSSRPGAVVVNSFEERKRVIPVIKKLVSKFPDIVISLDTIHSETAKAGIDEGVSVINDISGGLYDTKMIPTLSGIDIPFVVMHMRGTPLDMQQYIKYDDVSDEVFSFLLSRANEIVSEGVSQVILDPGFGFSKSVEQNYVLLNELNKICNSGFSVLAGLSRKSMIQKVINKDALHSLNGTSALNMVALMKGASILRVHDVKEAKEIVLLYTALQKSKSEAKT